MKTSNTSPGSRLVSLLSAGALALCLTTTAFAQGTTAFTYQGRLNDGTSPATGWYDLKFTLYDAASGGGIIAGTVPVVIPAAGVTNGAFTVALNFGPTAFTGAARWLDIAVRTNGALTFATLTPRQWLTPTPYALYAPSAGTAGSATTATIANGVVAGQVVKSLNLLKDDVSLVPGANLTLTPSGQTLTLASPADWHAGGNAGTAPGVNFLGTTDNQALELKVNGQRGLRLEPTADAPNVIAGYGLNAVTGGFTGATIAGGGGGTDPGTGPNQVGSPFGTIGGGSANRILGYAAYATIAGGLTNLIQGSSYYGTIGGGTGNRIMGNGFGITLSGGAYNGIGGADYVTLGGGAYNSIGDLAQHAVLAGGYGNVIGPGASDAVLGGGTGNRIGTNALQSTIGGGNANTVYASTGTIGGGADNYVYLGAFGATIGGGAQNLIQSSATYATIAGGWNNQVQGLPGGFAAEYGLIGGGLNNAIEPFGWGSVIGGGQQNRIQYDGDTAVIGGGQLNVIGTNADFSVIGGGYYNIISNNAQNATIPGGAQNVAGASFAFAAGMSAKANHQGAFVWADSLGGDFASTANNQFLIRAGGNVGINKNNPGSALDVNGTVTATGFSGPGTGLTGIPTTGLADNSITASKLASDGNSLAKVTAGKMSASGISLSLTVDEYLWDHDIYLRGDVFHGLGWYGAGKTFAGVNVNGPVLYGYSGGGLGFKNNILGTNLVLQWNTSGSIAMGHNTTASGSFSTAMGDNTTASGSGATAIGEGSRATGEASLAANYITVATNSYATALGAYTVSGGIASTALGMYSVATGNESVAMGQVATASGQSSIAMGHSTTAGGDYSTAMGYRAKAQRPGSLVWADSTAFDFDPYAQSGPQGVANSFNVRATTGFYIVTAVNSTNGGITAGTYITATSGGWQNLSDRSTKTGFEVVDTKDVLERLASIPITEWNYKDQPEAVRHIGPMAQDFNEAFSLGVAEGMGAKQYLSSMDVDGVALAAIQGLNQKLQEELSSVRADNAALKARLDRLEQLINTQNGGGK